MCPVVILDKQNIVKVHSKNNESDRGCSIGICITILVSTCIPINQSIFSLSYLTNDIAQIDMLNILMKRTQEPVRIDTANVVPPVTLIVDVCIQ